MTNEALRLLIFCLSGNAVNPGTKKKKKKK